MKYSLTTTPMVVVDSKSYDRMMHISAGNFSTAVAVYFRWAGTQNTVFILSSNANSKQGIAVSAGRRIEAYTDAGTADLAVILESGV